MLPSAPLSEGRRADRTGAAAVGAIALVAVGVPLAASWVTGALGIPQNDDWAFARVALGFARTGHIQLVHWSEMTLVGHVLWAWPFLKIFGASQTHLDIAGATAATLALVGAYALARRFTTRRGAVLVTAVVAAAPGFSTVSVTFMTDATGLAAQIAALLAGVAAVTSRRRPLVLYCAALALGAFAFSVRETGVGALVAVAVTFLWTSRRRWETLAPALGITLAAAAGVVVFYAWRRSLSGTETLSLFGAGLSSTSVGVVVRALFTVAFTILPVLSVAAVARRRQLASRLGLGAMTATIAVLAASWVSTRHTPWTLFSGDYFTRLGANPQGARVGMVLFPAPVWWLLVVLGIAASALAVGIAATSVRAPRHWRVEPSHALLALFAGVQVALLVVRGVSEGLLYDRYTWPLSLALAPLLLGGSTSRALRTRGGTMLAGASAAVIMLAGLAVAVNNAATSAAFWRAGEAGTRLGYRPETVDAGFEWVAAHALRGPGPYDGPPRRSYPLRWYSVDVFPYLPNCVVVSYPPLTVFPWLEPAGTVRFNAIVPPETRTLHLYRNLRACAGAPKLGAPAR